MLGKMFLWSMSEYDRVLYIDADVLPTAPMDALFRLPRTTFAAGATSPLNGGFALVHPSPSGFAALVSALAAQLPLLLAWLPARGGATNAIGGRSGGASLRESGDGGDGDGGVVAWGRHLSTWRCTESWGEGWSFPGAGTRDQGLLYAHCRFAEPCDVIVSIAATDGAGASGDSAEQHVVHRFTPAAKGGGLGSGEEPAPPAQFIALGWKQRFLHFSGPLKPWLVCPGDASVTSAVTGAGRDDSSDDVSLRRLRLRAARCGLSAASAIGAWHLAYLGLDQTGLDHAESQPLPSLVEAASDGRRSCRPSDRSRALRGASPTLG